MVSLCGEMDVGLESCIMTTQFYNFFSRVLKANEAEVLCLSEAMEGVIRVGPQAATGQPRDASPARPNV